ncbi:hypothetical protein B0T24DRAFT_540589, partial [Lasiosphaeria ovina]
SNMCTWEQTTYACGHKSKLRRQAYSCAIYTRHIYGECVYSRQYDRVIPVIDYKDCPDCSRLFEFVNF